MNAHRQFRTDVVPVASVYPLSARCVMSELHGIFSSVFSDFPADTKCQRAPIPYLEMGGISSLSFSRAKDCTTSFFGTIMKIDDSCATRMWFPNLVSSKELFQSQDSETCRASFNVLSHRCQIHRTPAGVSTLVFVQF